MTRNQLYTQIHLRLGLLGLKDQKGTMAMSYSRGKTDSLRAMSEGELIEFSTALIHMENKKLGPMRRKIIHLMCLMGYTRNNNRPDYEAINTWCKTHTRKKKRLNAFTYSELIEVTNQVEAWYKKELSNVQK